MKFSLRKKILVSIILILIISSISIAVSAYLYLNDYLVKDKLNNIEQLSLEQVHETAQIIEKNFLYAKMLSTQPIISKTIIDSSNINKDLSLKLLNTFASEDKKILSLYILDKEGKCLVSTDPRFVNQNYSFRDYFKKAINNEPNVDVFIGITSKQFGYYYAHPILDNSGKIIGVMVVKTDSSDVESSLSNSQVSVDNAIMLTDDLGIVIYSNKPDRYLKSLGQLTTRDREIITSTQKYLDNPINPIQYQAIKDVIDNYNSSVSIKIFDVEDNEDEVINVTKVANFPFFVVTEIGLENVSSNVYKITTILVVIILGFLLVLSIIVYKLITLLIRPIIKLKKLADNVSSGNFYEKMDINTNDEFEGLARSFNSMGRRLGDLYSNLDNKVKEQTNDLLKYKLAVDNATDQVVITDKEGIVIYGNPAVEKITGYTIEEAKGKKAGVLWKVPMPLEYYKNLWHTIKVEKKSFNSEIQNKRKTGELYRALISISPVLDEKGEILYFVAIERDITERIEAEDQIRKVLNSMQEQAQKLSIEKAKDDAVLEGIGDGVITTNEDGIIAYVNQSTLDMLGYSKEEMVGKPIVNMIKATDEKGDEIPLSRRPIVIALSTGEKTTIPVGSTHYYHRKDNKRFPINLTVTPFLFNGKIIGTIEVFRDITVEKDIDRAKTEFVSLASHQLRTPLSAIGWYSEMLLAGDAGKLSKKQKEFIDEIYTANKHMIEMVSSLLNVSRIELGTFSVDPELIDITEISENVLVELKPMILQKKMNISTKYESGLSKINLDPKLIRMVFQNLLTNALKYTSVRGNISIRIESKGDDVLISVADNGYGIPQSQQKEIFTKLFRADNAKANDTSGTGLGLYIIKSIVEQSSGGKIWFKSVENKGTTFYFTLPKKGVTAKKGSVPLGG